MITIVLVWGIKESAQIQRRDGGHQDSRVALFHQPSRYILSHHRIWPRTGHRFNRPAGAARLAGAAVVFFAYIGFDAVSTVAEETKNPARDLPIGIIASLIICTVFYVVVAAVFTGTDALQRTRCGRLSTEQAEPLTMALNHVAPDRSLGQRDCRFGSVVAHTAVLLVFQLGQPRIFFSMARDGIAAAGVSRRSIQSLRLHTSQPF